MSLVNNWVAMKYSTLSSDTIFLQIFYTLFWYNMFFLLFQVVEMDPTDELMHELIRGSTGHIAPEFDEDENDGNQFLNLHYHGDEEQDISGEEEENVEEAEV